MKTLLSFATSVFAVLLINENASGTASSECYTPFQNWLERYMPGRPLVPQCPSGCMSSEAVQFFDNEAATQPYFTQRCYKMKCPCICGNLCDELVQLNYMKKIDCPPNMGYGYVSCSATPPTVEHFTTSSLHGASENTVPLIGVQTTELMETSAIEKTTLTPTAETSLKQKTTTIVKSSSTFLTGYKLAPGTTVTSFSSPQQAHPTDPTTPSQLTSQPTTTSVLKTIIQKKTMSTIHSTAKSTITPLSSSPTTVVSPSLLPTGIQESTPTTRATSTTERKSTHAASLVTSYRTSPKASANSESSSPIRTQQPISTTVLMMESKTMPAIKSVTLNKPLSKTYTSSTVSLLAKTQGSLSTSYTTSTMERETTPVPTKSTTLYEILSKTPAGSTSSLHFGAEQSHSTSSTFHTSTTVERKTTAVASSATTLYEILSTSFVSSTSSLPFENQNSISTSSTSTAERNTSPATSSPTLYEILSKSSAAATSAVLFQTQEFFSPSPEAVTMESEATPSTRSATLYEILSKSAASSTDWSTKSATSQVEPLVSEPSLSSSSTEQPIYATRSGKVTGSASPFESGTIPSIASLEPGMETQETSSEKTLPSETTVDREMASTASVELEGTSYGAAEDMTVGATQEGLEQSTDHTGASETAQPINTTVNYLEGLISTAKDSAKSTHGNTAVHDFNKASTVTSTSYAEIYTSTKILSTLLNRGKASTTSVQLEPGDDQSTRPSGEPSDPTLRRTVSPPAEPVAVPSSTSAFVPPSFDKTTLKFVLGGMDNSTEASLTSKVFSTLRGFVNVTPPATPTNDSFERSPNTIPTDPNLDRSTPESTESQFEVRTTSDSSLQSTTRDFQCAYPCPIGLLEGPDYCYQLLKAQPLLNYRKAFHLCAVEGGSDMADEVDLRDPHVLQLLRNVSLSESDGAETRFFVNERDSKLYMEEKKVRVVSLKWSTRFFLNVNETVRPRQYVENVTAACKRPKFCGDYYCNLNDYEFLVPDSVLAIPETQNRTLAVGEIVTIRCNNSETDVVKVQCRQKGYLNPHPTRVACQEDRKLAFLKSQRIRKSCKECFPYGTQRCERVSEGFVCRCRTNWTEPTCWRAPNLCEINQVDCGENGRCVSEITQARCICNASFAGSHCSVNKTRLSFVSDTEASFISGTTAGASIIAMTGSLLLLIRGLLALFYQQQGNDPQTFYQNCRCFFVALAGLFAFLFRHPALLQITQIQCMFSSFVMTCSFLFGMAFFALEALTFYECASLTRLNSWTKTFWGRNRFYTTPAFRTLTPLIVLTAAVAGTFKGKPTDVASSWSCMGRFEPSTRNFWFPIALAHSCLGLAALAYTLEGRFKRANMPQFQQAVDEYLRPLPPSRKEEVEKCQRNHGLTAIGPWLLYTTWLFLALSADWVVSPTNYWAVACALGYSACELAIFALTTPQVYCAVLSTWTKLLTKRISPEAEPVPLRIRRRRQRRQRRQRRRGGRGLHTNRRRPKRKATISSKMGRRLKRRWTAKYKKLREQNKNKTKAQIVTMVFRKRVRHDLYHAKNEACRKRIRRLFDEWWTETYTADRKPDAVLKLKTRVDMYLEERAALMNSLVFLGGDGRGQATGDQQSQEPEEDRAIPLCYVSTVDDYGNTQIEEVMKTPAELAELTDSTFKIAVLNYDYLERSRSLRDWGPRL
ncbi:hypothetical protein Q1695_004113 [Nippostrongylus brasiliensis]|nr:hypothetical protein Q1695_004113 [Nippostrongylus brasiliensis]